MIQRFPETAKKVLSLMYMIFSLSVLFSTLVFAESNEGASHIIEYIHGDVSFSIYYVAEKSGDDFVPAPAYERYEVSFYASTTSEWRALAATLAIYTQRDSISETAVGKTAQDGALIFTGLKDGMYLIVGESYTRSGYIYTPVPYLIVLEGGLPNASEVKYEQEKEGDAAAPEYVNLSVKKIWKDSSNKTKRPKTVVIQLMQDGKVYDTVTLSAETQWKYTWKQLDNQYNWTVAEQEVPRGYTVAIERDGEQYIVTNSLKKNQAISTLKATPTTKPAVSSAVSKTPPKTGDNTHTERYIMLWTGSLLLMLVLLIINNKLRKGV